MRIVRTSLTYMKAYSITRNRLSSPTFASHPILICQRVLVYLTTHYARSKRTRYDRRSRLNRHHRHSHHQRETYAAFQSSPASACRIPRSDHWSSSASSTPRNSTSVISYPQTRPGHMYVKAHKDPQEDVRRRDHCHGDARFQLSRTKQPVPLQKLAGESLSTM